MKPRAEAVVRMGEEGMTGPESGEYWIVKRSKIHAAGLFARREIPSGTRIIEYVGERITKRESERRGEERVRLGTANGGATVFIFNLTSRYDLDGDVPENPARFMNHSCSPNCEAVQTRGRIWLYALRTIRPGEELTFDYGYELEHWEENPCRCGSTKCAGYIVATAHRRKLGRILRLKSKALSGNGSKSGSASC